MIPRLRPPRADDLDALVALNNASAVETSFLTPPAMQALLASAFHVRIAGEIAAFCIALDQDAPYDSPNFTWFRQRFPRFVYIDRIIVAPHLRGHGIARNLYQNLLDAASNAHHALLCCEVNVSPPNPVSDRFHQAFGFVEIGQAVLAGGMKMVRYMTLAI